MTGARHQRAMLKKWRAKYGGIDASMMARMKELEGENRRLKKMYAEERLKAEIVAEALTKKWKRHLSGERWRSGPWHNGQLRLRLTIIFVKGSRT